MSRQSVIRDLVNRALLIKSLTPELENMINSQLATQGYISDNDYEALEYLMQAVDQGKVRQTASSHLQASEPQELVYSCLPIKDIVEVF